MPLALKNCSCTISSYSFRSCWRHRTKTLIDMKTSGLSRSLENCFDFSNYLTRPYNHHWIRWSWRPYAGSSCGCKTIMLHENIKKIKHERQTAIKIFKYFLFILCFTVSVHCSVPLRFITCLLRKKKKLFLTKKQSKQQNQI